MVTTLRVTSPADLITVASRMVGSEPTRSLVVLGQRGHLQSAALRVDLPPDDASAAHQRVATHLVGLLCKVPDLRGIVVAVFSDHRADAGPPHVQFVDTMMERFDHSGIRIIEAVWKARDGWGTYFDDEEDSPRSLTLLDSSLERYAATLPAHVEAPPIPVATEDRTRVRARIAELSALLTEVRESCTHDDACECGLPELEPLFDIPVFVEAALGWSDVEVLEHAPIMILALQGPPVRDMVMLQWAFGFEVGCIAETANDRFASNGMDLDDSAANLLADLLGGHGPFPNVERIEHALRMLAAFLSLAEESQRPPLLSMLAWLNWAVGRGSHAGRHLDRLLAIDPGYGMGEILGYLTAGGALPEWMFQRPEERGLTEGAG